MKSELLPSRFFASSALQSPYRIAKQDHLIGLRGLLVLQSFLFVFFQTFLPAAVPDSNNIDGPLYQRVLRKSFSVIFCNEALIYGWIIFLSARTICLSYLSNTSKEVCASSIFRRNLRLWIPAFVAYSLAAAAFSKGSSDYITEYFNLTGNISATTPLRLRNFLVYFNSLFDIFWVNKQYNDQAANKAFPSGTFWIVSLLFQQSYTVYMTMVIIPFTRTSWRVKAFFAIIVTAFWVQSWAWYSVTGLLIADAVLNMNFQSRSRGGLRLGGKKIPIWPLYATTVLVGVLMQFLTISWNPDMRDNELYAHTGLYTDGMLNEKRDKNEPAGRVDAYLVILGASLLIETFDWPQKVLRSRVLLAIGRRSFSIFLVQSIMIYTAGIKLWLHLYRAGGSDAVNSLVCFIVCAPLVAVASEVFYRIVDVPSVVFARCAWAWMTK
ncbi:hypothetical protein EK21DRAFT_62393 [Setomelanomma holmii]|uniref:Acyltransferase 3 domain-containing protein n=1 Tax=Setomelanomma holmii TaxID=210430 RepID=A0A9P4LQD8_9PLEO|nr:hypothetical protein EK21DRAFT_62393 [Setomelanomma holmii]